MSKKFKDYIFLHITKTGGSSIGILFRDGLIDCPPHTHIKNLDYENKKIFYCVRNPYTRIYSQYDYFVLNGKANIIEKNVSFEEFVMNYESYNKSNGKPELDFKNYEYVFKSIYDLVTINGENKGYKFLRFEYLEDDFKNLMKEEFNLDMELPHINKNKKKKPFNMKLFTPQMLKKVNELFHNDFIEYGYKKIEK